MKANIPCGFFSAPVNNVHFHSYEQHPVGKTIEIFNKTMEVCNCGKIAINTLPWYGRLENEKGFYFKSNIENVYLNCGPVLYYDDRDTQEGLYEQIKMYHAMGCDGIKLLEGKPKCRLKLGKRLDDPLFDKFFAYAEENGLPVLYHIGDPPQWWHKETCPQAAIDLGWSYMDPKYTPFDELVNETEGILAKFPNLKLTAAHFFFMGDRLEYLDNLFDKYENFAVDITPGSEMCRHFTLNYDNAKAFFVKHQDRILYGTDTYNWAIDGPDGTRRHELTPEFVRTYLEQDEEFENTLADWVTDKPFRPFAFEGEILDKIYRTNFTRRWGETPRPLDNELIARWISSFNEFDLLTDLDKENLNIIKKYWSV